LFIAEPTFSVLACIVLFKGKQMFRTAFKLLGRKKNLSILIYHQVLPAPDPLRPYEIDAKQFDNEVKWLSYNFTLMTLRDAMQHMAASTLPVNSAVITFDDGYENNVSQALPILQKYQVPATFFISSDFLNGGAMWNDKIIEFVRRWPEPNLELEELPGDIFDTSSLAAKQASAEVLLSKLKYLPLANRASAVARLESLQVLDGLMMSDQQVVELHKARMEIGGHTCSHPILAKLDEEQASRQITENKTYLENLLGEKIESFAYPNGKPGRDYHAKTCSLVKQAGYQWAVSTSPGTSNSNTDVFQLARFSPWRKQEFGFLSLLVKNYFTNPDFV
jgi:peptidoglycan/xylan/chitin deacetylase (PgdA/CDA1 family)